MKTGNVPRRFVTRLNSLILVGVFIILAAVVAVPFYSAQSSSSPPSGGLSGGPLSGSGSKSPILPLGNYSFLLPVPQGGTATTYASDCTTAKSVFNLQDTDKTVCAKVTGADPSWRIIWSNSNFIAVQNVAVGTGTSTFTLTANSSLGDWRVILYDPFGGTVQAVTSFTVIDAANPSADLSISKNAISSDASAGNQVVFSLQVTNGGPSDATSVQVSDDVPANTTFVSFGQLSGPTFSCTSPNAGDTGTTVCTIASLARGETAVFVGTYTVGAVSSGTEISNTATVASTGNTATPDPNTDNNSSTVVLTVAPSPCQLSTPDNITVPVDSGQSGAVVTYTTPTGTGDCGQPSTGENGETIPAISCSPASGSFFPVGTNTVICSAQTGAAVTFLVTVQNPGGLSISLNGPSSVSIECGSDFADPAASAVDGTGQSVPVSIAYTGNFDPNAPAVGTYTATYTATQDQNSVSTTRTIVVSDTEAPAITVAGANPYRIIQGSCVPFSDPGASANDGCAGPKPVTSSISGPNGLTSVNNNTPGTYTVTYTATDGTHQATATRTVLVGQFNQDESDQPASSNQPPTITLNGDDQMSIECGTPFTDPGATASVCGGSVQVTTSGTVDIHAPGTYVITYTATANNLTTTATRTVTVTPDNTAPTITVNGANPMTVECHTSFTDPGATAHDACAGNFAATASGAVDPNTVGTYTITYNATDPSGFAAAPVTRTVNVVDTTAPTVTAPANVTVNTGGGATSCGATVSDATLGTASATDSCAGSLSVTRTGVPAGNVFPVGQTTITYSANDGHNTGTATQTVTVLDNTPPTISCAANITKSNDPGQCGAVVTYTTPVGSDNCSGATTAQKAGLPSGSTFPVGTTTNTFEVTDASGNKTSCSFTVTVNDTEAPSISCPSSFTLEPTCPSGAIATYTAPVGTDNCPGATTTRTAGGASGSVFPIGTTTVTYTVNDAHGNSTSCSFTVTVKTVVQTIEDLKTSVNSSSLNGTQRQGLIAKLQAAEDALAIGHTSTACQKLADFINSVQNYIDHANISAAVGNAWISTAAHVRNTIGCTSNPCT